MFAYSPFQNFVAKTWIASSSLAVCASMLLCCLVRAEDAATSRDVKVQGEEQELQINQVDTSRFPKVDIFATVMRKGEPVMGLTAADFRVREDEVDQEPIIVEPKLSPLSVVVTLDTSGSMSKAIGAAKTAAKSFVDTLGSEDSFAVLSFSRAVQILAPIGTSKDGAKASIDATTARGDTALYDALYSSVEAVKARPGRKAAVLLSDGVDDDGTGKQLSRHSVGDAIALAQQINVPIFTIGLGTQIDEAVLRQVASQTGGGFFKAPTVEDLAKLYSGIGKQLTGQYHISYTSNLPPEGRTHTIQLGYGALRSNKQYVAPGNAAPVAVSVAPRAAAAVEAPLSIVGGVSLETAEPILTGRTYQLDINSDTDEGTMQFFSFDAQSGDSIIVIAQGIAKAEKTRELTLYDTSLTVVQEKTIWFNPWSAGRVAYFVADEKAGKMIIGLKGKGKMTLGVFAKNFGDGAAGRDAGNSEGRGLEIASGAVVDGHLQEITDPTDAYRVSVTSPGDYQFRARPDLEHGLELEVFDSDGNQIASAKSKNAGAGVTLDVTIENPGTYVVGVKTVSYLSAEGIGTYRASFGPKGIAAPQQPDKPELLIVNPPHPES